MIASQVLSTVFPSKYIWRKISGVMYLTKLPFSTSVYNFELADVDMLVKLFDMYEQESLKICKEGIVLPAYDYCLKCSHTFNLLDARGAISVNERTKYIDRIRTLARKVSKNYLAQREEMGYPLLKKD